MKVYLDNAATTQMKKSVFKAIKPYFINEFGNASSVHGFGIRAKMAIEKSRVIVASFLNCKEDEVVFNSGGTESDNLAIRGSILRIGGKNTCSGDLPHIITTAFEHHAVLHTCQDLEKRGLAEVSYVKPGRNGVVDVFDIKKEIRRNTRLVSVMYVNNEIGTVQPIAEIGRYLETVNRVRKDDEKVIFHTDAVQATEYQEMNVNKLKVDLLSMSAHKIGGPKGVGVLYVKKGIKLSTINIGGSQENGLRGGTYNTSGIVGMAKAVELIKNDKIKQKKIKKLTDLRNYFIDRVLKEIDDTFLNGSREKRNPNNVNISFRYIEGEAIILHLDQAGIAASSGSACTSGSLDPSHVLLSIGLKHEDAHGSIRFTLSEKNTKKEIDYTIDVLKKTVSKLREMSPFGK